MFYLFFPLSILYLEIIARFSLDNLLYVILFSLTIGFLLTALSRKRWIATFFIVIITILICAQTVYKEIFKTYATLYSVTGAGKVFENYWRETLKGIWDSKVYIILELLPLIAWLVFKKKLFKKPSFIIMIVSFVIMGFAATYLVLNDEHGVMSPSYLYKKNPNLNLAANRFGILTMSYLDLRPEIEEPIQPANTSSVSQTPQPSPESNAVSEETTVEYNVQELNINVEGMDYVNQFISSKAPTNKNEYSGVFEGRNLVWICAESFSLWALNEEHCPTLCKLYDEGYTFYNYYNPLWELSTSDGEYTTLLSLLPVSGTWTFSSSQNNYFPYSIANSLNEMGYNSFAYHNNDYAYYNRNKTHKNIGYKYKGLNGGLNIEYHWPESDVDMAEASVPDYVSAEPFNVYYMTVSGHLHYNFVGNEMCVRHYLDVQDLLSQGWSETCSAYIACQMELDQALEYLIENLPDDTVFVLSNDHYPYGLPDKYLEQFNGGPLENEFEKYRSPLIIWSKDIDHKVFDKVCCPLDILPTLLNMFGVEYDSRLLMGNDIMSDSPGLVVFADRSWISDEGYYNATSDETSCDTEYAVSTAQYVNDMFDVSREILQSDYYRLLFETNGLPA